MEMISEFHAALCVFVRVCVYTQKHVCSKHTQSERDTDTRHRQTDRQTDRQTHLRESFLDPYHPPRSSRAQRPVSPCVCAALCVCSARYLCAALCPRALPHCSCCHLYTCVCVRARVRECGLSHPLPPFLSLPLSLSHSAHYYNIITLHIST